MATPAEILTTQERIDYYMDYLLAEWKDVPEIAREWDEWTPEDQLDFVIEWPIREDRLHQLEEWSAQGLLTVDQRTRYNELLKLVAEVRPTLERLLAD